MRWICFESLEPRLLLDGQPTGAIASQLLIDDSLIRLQYEMPDLQVELTDSADSDDVFAQLTLGEAPLSADPGMPILPLVPTQIVLPYGYRFDSLSVTPGDLVTLDGTYNIETADWLSADGFGDDLALADPATIEPRPIVDILGVQRSRGVNILTANLSPVAYAADSGELSYFASLTLNVTLALDAAPDTNVRFRADDIDSLAAAVDNPDVLATYEAAGGSSAPLTSGLCDPADTYEYVVITDQTMAGATTDYTLADFVAHKQSMGYSTIMVTVEDIVATYGGIDTPEQIRNFITDAYNNWETDDVLLGGDTNVVEPRIIYVNQPYWDPDDSAAFFASDLYYQCLDGSFNFDGDEKWGEPTDGIGGREVDFLHEVFIGRASANTPEEMANWVYKTIAHETNVASEHRWNAAFIGEWMGHTGIGNWAKYKMEEVRLGADTNGYTTAGFASDDRWISDYPDDTLYERDRNSADEIDPDDLIEWQVHELADMMNSNQYGVFTHAGHAIAARLMKMVAEDVDALTNENFFFIYSGSCKPGKFTINAIAEDFTTSTRNGAYAAVLNSGLGWSYRDDTTQGPSHHLLREFYDAMFSEGITQLGAMNADSHVDSLGYAGIFAYRWVLFATTVFGDPSLEMTSNELALGAYGQPVGAMVDQAYQMDLVARNGAGGYDWQLTGGALPDGLALDTATGRLAGTPTALGEFTFTVELTDAAGESVAATYTIAVAEPLEIVSPSPADPVIDQPYTHQPQATGGDGALQWRLINSLPKGLTLD
ncbi:MAG: C25 family cysteine peptidase, partial [Planctomycetota bacterium]